MDSRLQVTGLQWKEIEDHTRGTSLSAPQKWTLFTGEIVQRYIDSKDGFKKRVHLRKTYWRSLFKWKYFEFSCRNNRFVSYATLCNRCSSKFTWQDKNQNSSRTRLWRYVIPLFILFHFRWPLRSFSLKILWYVRPLLLLIRVSLSSVSFEMKIVCVLSVGRVGTGKELGLCSD